VGRCPLITPKSKKLKTEKTKTTEEENAFLSTCGTKDESKIDERN